MKIGISRISQTPDEAYEVLREAQRHGFEGVQLKPSQYSEFIECPSAFFTRYGALAELARGGLVFYPGDDPLLWVKRVTRVLPFAAHIRANHICLCSGVYSTAASEAQVCATADALTKVRQHAQQHGIAISIHNHVDSLVETEDDIARLLARLDPKLCGLTLDTAHAAKAGISNVEHLVERFQQHLINVHLKDLTADGQFCALGQGTLAIHPILDSLTSINYQQWLIVDEETTSLDTKSAMRIASDYLKKNGFLC